MLGMVLLPRLETHSPHPEERPERPRLEGWGPAPRSLPILRDATLRVAPQDEVGVKTLRPSFSPTDTLRPSCSFVSMSVSRVGSLPAMATKRSPEPSRRPKM